MKRSIHSVAGLCLSLVIASTALAHDDRPILRPFAGVTFAKLPDGVAFPEGIAADPYTGDIFVATFIFGAEAENKLFRFNRSGHLEATLDFGPQPLLGLAFNSDDYKVYIANVANLNGQGPPKIQRVPAGFDASSAVEDVVTIPDIGPPPNRVVPSPDQSGATSEITFADSVPAPNALTFDYGGDLFVSDSFQGAVFMIGDPADCPCPPGDAVTVVQHELLGTVAFPPFGANGLAFGDEDTLFVANTGDDVVLKIDLGDATVTPFSQSINGADGMLFDDSGTLWVVANQADEIVALNEKGRVIARLGAFRGIRNNGAPRGLLFPASPVIVGNKLFVTNLALPLGSSEGEPEADVETWTVSRFRIPQALR